jgi:hypothetical protein
MFQFVQTLTINATVDDHGKEVTCKAALFDGLSAPLYKLFEAKKMSLNVTFRPQKMVSQEAKVEEGKNGQVTFVFKANPAPTLIKWLIEAPPTKSTGGGGGEDTTGGKGD